MASNWQNNLNSWKERNRYILKSGLRADCCFLVGVFAQQRRFIQAHKFLLAGASPVFECMFFGSLPENGDEPIAVLDIDADDFEKLLLFIYTGEIWINAMDEAHRLYFAAEKYMLIPLKKACIDFFCLKIKCENVCQLFEFSKRFEEKKLEEACTNQIRNDTHRVLNSTSFLNADMSTVDFILDQDNLNIVSELQLFTALEKFANLRFPIEKRVDCDSMCQTCQRQKSESSAPKKFKNEKTQDARCQNIEPTEDILKLFRKIRFLTLTDNEFVTGGPAHSKFISKSDASKILRCMRGIRNTKSHFPIGFSVSEVNRNINFRIYYSLSGDVC